MRIKELIELLQTFDQNTLVAYQLYSDYCLMEASDVKILNLCEARPDGWVQNARPDKVKIPYVVFPGN